MSINLPILKDLVIVQLKVSGFTGKKKLKRSEIKGEVPPEELATTGSKRTIDPRAISYFDACKRRAERFLAKNGIRILGGYGIPVKEMKRVSDELNAIKGSFYEAKTHFLNDYDSLVRDWIDASGEWADIIRNDITDKSYIEKQLGFSFFAYNILPTGVEGADDGVLDEIDDIGFILRKEICEEATEIYKKSIQMKVSIVQKTLNPVKALRDKMKNLGFISENVNALSLVFDEVLDILAPMSKIENRELIMLSNLLRALSKPSDINRIGQMVIDGGALTEFGIAKSKLLDIFEDEKDDLDNSFDPANASPSGDDADLLNETQDDLFNSPVVPDSSNSSVITPSNPWF